MLMPSKSAAAGPLQIRVFYAGSCAVKMHLHTHVLGRECGI